MKNQYLFLFFFITSFSFAQSIKFEGLITDSKATGLEMANVMAINKATKAMDAYAITNDKGKFLLNLKPNTAYNIKISYLGMQNKSWKSPQLQKTALKALRSKKEELNSTV